MAVEGLIYDKYRQYQGTLDYGSFILGFGMGLISPLDKPPLAIYYLLEQGKKIRLKNDQKAFRLGQHHALEYLNYQLLAKATQDEIAVESLELWHQGLWPLAIAMAIASKWGDFAHPGELLARACSLIDDPVYEAHVIRSGQALMTLGLWPLAERMLS